MPSKREEYQLMMTTKLDLWDARLASLTSKAGERAKVEFREQLTDWKQNGKAARAKLDELAAATGDRWDEIKPALDHLWQQLALALDGADERCVDIPAKVTLVHIPGTSTAPSDPAKTLS